MNEKILKALQQLDVNNANHWTNEGLPRIETVRMLAADGSLSRDDITAAAEKFSRANPVLETPTAPATPAGVPTPPTATETPVAGAVAPTATVETAAGAPLPTAAQGYAQQNSDEVVDASPVNAVAPASDNSEELRELQERLSQFEEYGVRLSQEVAKAQARYDELVSMEAEKPKEDPMAAWKAHIEGKVERDIAFQQTLGDQIKALGKLPSSRSELDKAVSSAVLAKRKAGQ